jgi:hypothetical protein
VPAALSTLRTGLANALATIANLRVYELVPDNPQHPSATVRVDRVSFDSTMARGSDEFEFIVTVVVGRADDRTAQTKLETYIAGTGSQSVKAALESDPTLGGVAMACRVQAAQNIGTLERPDGTSLLAVDFIISVYA